MQPGSAYINIKRPSHSSSSLILVAQHKKKDNKAILYICHEEDVFLIDLYRDDDATSSSLFILKVENCSLLTLSRCLQLLFQINEIKEKGILS